jgi:hypothetical protein
VKSGESETFSVRIFAPGLEKLPVTRIRIDAVTKPAKYRRAFGRSGEVAEGLMKVECVIERFALTKYGDFCESSYLEEM